MSKRIVHYDKEKGVSVLAGRAYLYPVDHPDHSLVSNTKMACTSLVVTHEGDRIETLNTVYLPKEQ